MSYEWMGTGDWASAASPLNPMVLPRNWPSNSPKLPFFSRNRTATRPEHREKGEGITHIPLSSLLLTKRFLSRSGAFSSCWSLFISRLLRKSPGTAWFGANGSWLEKRHMPDVCWETVPGRCRDSASESEGESQADAWASRVGLTNWDRGHGLEFSVEFVSSPYNGQYAFTLPGTQKIASSMGDNQDQELLALFLCSRHRLLEQSSWKILGIPGGQGSPNCGMCTSAIEKDDPLGCWKKILKRPAILILFLKNKKELYK